MERTATKEIGAKTGQPVLGVPARSGFHLGPLTIHFYSLTMVTAIIAGYFVSLRQAKKRGISQVFFDDLVFWLIVNSFIGARIYHVISSPAYYARHPLDIIKIWQGGLGIYGAIFFGIATVYYFARKYKVSLLLLLDVFAVGMPLAQAIGRLGNYFNIEAFGGPTNLPWGMYVPVQFRPIRYQQYFFFHPTFLYEMVWNLLLFLLLVLLSRRQNVQNRPGIIIGVYLVLYSFGRFFIEYFRVDSVYVGVFKLNQIVPILVILLTLIVFMNKRKNGAQVI